ncbi:membrane protein [Paenibacillus sp. URB8-2]|nr:membrane protein [Paenibacillus sp. URB8-2]
MNMLGEFMLGLLNIIFLDLVLAGDNAIVIGLAARNLHPATQKKAIVLGTAGAVVLRIAATLLVVWLLEIPWLRLAGGMLLLWIAYKLLTDGGGPAEVKAGDSIGSAVRTIIVADAAMGLDNVIAIAGAARHNTVLVALGLLISVPIVVWGSTLFIRLLSNFPWIIYAGAAVLGYTAAGMIAEEREMESFFASHPLLRALFYGLVITVILAAGYRKRRSGSSDEGQEKAAG